MVWSLFHLHCARNTHTQLRNKTWENVTLPIVMMLSTKMGIQSILVYFHDDTSTSFWVKACSSLSSLPFVFTVFFCTPRLCGKMQLDFILKKKWKKFAYLFKKKGRERGKSLRNEDESTKFHGSIFNDTWNIDRSTELNPSMVYCYIYIQSIAPKVERKTPLVKHQGPFMTLGVAMAERKGNGK